MSGRQFAVIVSITFIVGMIWLISDIIFNTKASITVSPKLETLLAPINPSFNSRVLDIIDKEVLNSVPASLAPPATPKPSPVSTASSPFPSPVPSTSAQLSPSPAQSSTQSALLNL